MLAFSFGASEQQSADRSVPPLQPTGQVRGPSGGNVAILKVNGMIDSFTLISLQRRIDRAVAAGASIIVLELNTDGGDAMAGIEISKYLKSLQNVTTIAWINNRAYSAGTLIASACDEIVMTPASALGDSAVIQLFESNMGATERAKLSSPILAEYRDNARANGYDPALFKAMTVLGVKVYLIRHKQTGEQRLVNQVDYDVMVRGADPTDKLELDYGAMAADKSKIEQVVKPSLVYGTQENRGQWQPVTQLPSGQVLPEGQLHDGSTLLTLDQTIAKDIGLNRGIAATPESLATFLQANKAVYVTESWSERIADFFMNMWVRAILLVIMLVGMFLEFNAPGTGIFGVAAFVAMLLLIGAPFIAGVADVWHIILFALGCVLIVVEITLLPSFGLLGVIGLVLVFVGLVLSVVPTTPQSPGFGPVKLPAPQMWNRTMLSALTLLLATGIAIVVLSFFVKSLDKLPMFQKFILQDQQPSRRQQAETIVGSPGSSTGDTWTDHDESPLEHPEQWARNESRTQQSPPPDVESPPAPTHTDAPAPGSVGQAQTALRPAGMAEIDGRLYDVVLERGMAAKGERVKVLAVHGNVVTVERA